MNSMDFMSTLSRHAGEFADRRAVLFRDRRGEQALTYGELHLAALRIGGWLAERVEPGARVLLCYPSGLEFVEVFLGCLAAGVVAVPAPFPDASSLHRERVLAVAADAEPALALTSAPLVEALTAALAGSEPGLEAQAAQYGDPLPRPHVTEPGSLAFLQYTSGSTSDAKGVMVTHRSLVDTLRVGAELLDLREGARFCSWLPMHHDMGLVAMLLLPLHLGGATALMAPTDFLRHPWLWLDLIGRHGAEVSAAPNFAYDLCVRRVTDQQLHDLDLSSWKHVCNGAEPIDAGTLTRFADRFAAAGLKPESLTAGYGMAETTLFISGTAPGHAPVVTTVDPWALERDTLDLAATGRALVGCGRPRALQVLIADPDTGAELPEGRVGEIWVRGPGVAAGYWRKPEETRRTFGGTTATGEGGFLRTGDLGALLEGELYITGRIKDLVIVNGRNLYPHDLERALTWVHAAAENMPSCVFSVAVPREEIVVVQEVRSRALASPGELVEEIRSVLSRKFGVGAANVCLVRPGEIRRTTSGKIRRQVTRQLFASGGLTAHHEALSPTVIAHYRKGHDG
ncbi:fatty acyl-AMP ligase [Nonomuraea angiospora]|uniref:fatty acyl-AMP ligase n=1 Tax=Nonomuraea angiospora TaxID=46172 RepID=UPI0029AD106D|nr:fatty acyl-AMP ligase [Nonomuraea angiospora]MDX3100853.1 fatty acyl-AMP ligase [Nonomuraea angiospora]